MSDLDVQNRTVFLPPRAGVVMAWRGERGEGRGGAHGTSRDRNGGVPLWRRPAHRVLVSSPGCATVTAAPAQTRSQP